MLGAGRVKPLLSLSAVVAMTSEAIAPVSSIQANDASPDFTVVPNNRGLSELPPDLVGAAHLEFSFHTRRISALSDRRAGRVPRLVVLVCLQVLGGACRTPADRLEPETIP